ncbi:MAG: hypothetical protein KJ808_06425 [Acidobacteria bacterium]|nr:hypothetical protein [Acidobacteriota bacterium]MBU4405937.1 hypothetical protein [Acidobacteriota bacterium]MCG2811885.1 hypothetical protein [Candidatus Aminicenantes bacterium]
MKQYRKMPTQKEMLDQLRRGLVVLTPLSFRFLEETSSVSGNRHFDALIEVCWNQNMAKFAVECKALSTPKAFWDGINLLKSQSIPKGCYTMLFRPFFSERQLQDLEQERISGIDLCGNGVVIIPGKYAVFRSGGRNKFSTSAPIKNIYRKNSSMVSRVFCLRSSYATVQEIYLEINRRNLLVNRWNKKPISLSTVSKALKTLEEDLIVARKEIIRLLQPDKLLEKLSQYYDPPAVKKKVRLKVSVDGKALRELLMKLADTMDLPIIATGISSVNQYAVMQREDILSIYCPRLEMLLKQLPGNETDRFPNLELLETEDEVLYFDARQEGDFCWASPLQVYLELMAGDKRDQETAGQVLLLLLKELEQV